MYSLHGNAKMDVQLKTRQNQDLVLKKRTYSRPQQKIKSRNAISYDMCTHTEDQKESSCMFKQLEGGLQQRPLMNQ